MRPCTTPGCINPHQEGTNLCSSCLDKARDLMRAFNSTGVASSDSFPMLKQNSTPDNLATKYPKYYKDVRDIDDLDVYTVHNLFNIQDPSGCIQHASKKLLLSGVRTGGKSMFKDISEARDTLTRWLQLNPE